MVQYQLYTNTKIIRPSKKCFKWCLLRSLNLQAMIQQELENLTDYFGI